MKNNLESICKVINRRLEMDLLYPDNFTILKVTKPNAFGLVTATILVDAYKHKLPEELLEYDGRQFIQRRVEFDPTEVVSIESLEISGASELEAYANTKFTFNIIPSDWKIKNIQWSCAYGTIDQDGNYTATYPGVEEVITLVIDGVRVTYKVTIKAEVISIVDFEVVGPTELEFGANYKFDLILDPPNTTIDQIIWSADKGTIDQDGNYTATTSGPVTLTVTVNDRTETFVFTVKEEPPKLLSIDLQLPEQTPYGEEVQASVTWEEPDYVPDSIQWTIDKGTIDNTGKFVADQGPATVTVTVMIDGVSVSKTIIVDARIPELISGEIVGVSELEHLSSTQFSFSWLEAEYQVSKATWSVDNGVIDQDGNYTATVPNTSATIKVLLDDTLELSKTITVGEEIIYATGIKTIAPIDSVEAGSVGDYSFSYEWIPANANRGKSPVKFLGSDLVDEVTGKLTIPTTSGIATITATPEVSVDNLISASVNITAAGLDEVIIVGPSSGDFKEPIQLDFEVVPDFYQYQNVTWFTDKGTITQDGLLTHDIAEEVTVRINVDGVEATKVITFTSEAEEAIRNVTLVVDKTTLAHREVTTATVVLDLVNPDYVPETITWGVDKLELTQTEDKLVSTLTASAPSVTGKVYVVVDGLYAEAIITVSEERPELVGFELVKNTATVNELIDGTLLIDPDDYIALETIYKVNGQVIDLNTFKPTDDTGFELEVIVDGESKTFPITVSYPAITDLVINLSEGPYYTNEPINVTVTPIPDFVPLGSVEMTTDNGTITDGVWTPANAGPATVEVKVGDVVKTATINVIASLTGISISGPEETLAGQPVTLTVSPIPDTASIDGLVLWSSDNDKVTVIDGVVTPSELTVGNPTVTITATFNEFTATHEILIKELTVTGVTIEGPSEVTKGVDQQFLARLVPEVVTADVTWATVPVRDDVTIVDGLLKINTTEITELVITATAGEITATHNLVVIQPVESFEIKIAPSFVMDGMSNELSYVLSPPTAQDLDGVEWSILEGSEYATIVENEIFFKDAANKTVILQGKIGEITATRELEVQPVPLEEILVTSDPAIAYRDQEIQLHLEFVPSIATFTEGTWSVTPEEGVVVTEDGKLTVTSNAVTEVTATYTVGEITGSVTIPTIQQISGLILYTTPEQVTDNTTIDLNYAVVPATAVDTKSGIWSIVGDTPEGVTLKGKQLVLENAYDKTFTVQYTQDGITETLELTVLPVEAESINFATYSITPMVVDEVRDIIVEFNPVETSDKSGTWSILPIDAGTITQNGTFTPNGSASPVRVTFEHAIGAISADIDVNIAVDNVVIEAPEEVTDFSTFNYKVTVEPAAATIISGPNVTVSGSTALTLDEEAKSVTLTGTNDATLSINVEVNGIIYVKDVTVKPLLATSIDIENVPTEITLGNQVQLTAVYEPDQISDPTAVWSVKPATSATISPDGLLKIIQDPVEEFVEVTLALGGLTKTVKIDVPPTVQLDSLMIPVTVDAVRREALVEAGLISDATTATEVVVPSITVTEQGYLGQVVYPISERNRSFMMMYRIAQETADQLNNLKEANNPAIVASIVGLGLNSEYSAADLLDNTIVVEGTTYFYLEVPYNEQGGRISATIDWDGDDVIYKEGVSTVDMSIKILQPSRFTPVTLTTEELQEARDKDIIGVSYAIDSSTVVTYDSVAEEYTVNIEMPNKGITDYGVYGLRLDASQSAELKETLALNPLYKVATLNGVFTAQDLAKATIENEAGEITWVVRQTRNGPDVAKHTAIIDWDSNRDNYDVSAQTFNVSRTIALPGEGDGVKLYISPIATTNVVLEAAKAAGLVTNLSETARVSIDSSGNIFKVNAFYPTSETAKSVPLTYVVPSATLNVIKDNLSTNLIPNAVTLRIDGVEEEMSLTQFMDRTFVIGNTTYFAHDVLYREGGAAVEVIIDLDGSEAFDYEAGVTEVYVTFDLASPSGLTPATPTPDVAIAYALSGFASPAYDDTINPTLTGTTFNIVYPFTEEEISAPIAFEMSRESYDSLQSAPAVDSVMRITTNGVTRTLLATEVRLRTYSSGGRYFFVDEVLFSETGKIRRYEYDWDGTGIFLETGVTEVLVTALMEEAPDDPRSLSNFRIVTPSNELVSKAKEKGLLSELYSDKVIITAENAEESIKATYQFTYEGKETSTLIAYQLSRPATTVLLETIATYPDAVFMRGERLVNTSGIVQTVYENITGRQLLERMIVISDYGYVVNELKSTDDLLNVTWINDWDQPGENYRSTTVVVEFTKINDPEPKESMWIVNTDPLVNYSYHVTAASRGEKVSTGAIMTAAQFEENITVTKVDEYNTIVSGLTVTDKVSLYAPIPLAIHQDLSNIIRVLYSTSANRNKVIGTLYDSRTDTTTELTLAEFWVNKLYRYTSRGPSFLQMGVNCANFVSEFTITLNFDFDIDGVVYKSTPHNVTISNRLADVKPFLRFSRTYTS